MDMGKIDSNKLTKEDIEKIISENQLLKEYLELMLDYHQHFINQIRRLIK